MKIVIFSTKQCTNCNILKNYLQGENLDYFDHDIQEDPAAREYALAEFRKLGVTRPSLPLVEVDDKTFPNYMDAIEHIESNKESK